MRVTRRVFRSLNGLLQARARLSLPARRQPRLSVKANHRSAVIVIEANKWEQIAMLVSYSQVTHSVHIVDIKYPSE